LVWLGCADPVDTLEAARKSDPVLGTLRAVLECWHAAFGDEGRTTAQVAAALSSIDPTTTHGQALLDLRSALAPVASVAGSIDPTRLGYWLRKVRDRRVGRLRFTGNDTRAGVQAWRVI
jgi:hypothetical protein